MRAADGTISDVEVPGASGTNPNGSDDSGAVSGEYIDHHRFHGFIEAPDGTFKTFDPQGSVTTLAYEINRKGEIASWFRDASKVWHGYTRKADGTIAIFDPPGSRKTEIYAVNASGAIAGFYKDHGRFHGFLRTP